MKDETYYRNFFRTLMIIRVMAVIPLLALAIGMMVALYQLGHPYQVVTINDAQRVDTAYSIIEAKKWSTGDTLFGIYRKVDPKIAFQGKIALNDQQKLVKLTSDRNTALVYADSIQKYSVVRNYIISIKKL